MDCSRRRVLACIACASDRCNAIDTLWRNHVHSKLMDGPDPAHSCRTIKDRVPIWWYVEENKQWCLNNNCTYSKNSTCSNEWTRLNSGYGMRPREYLTLRLYLARAQINMRNLRFGVLTKVLVRNRSQDALRHLRRLTSWHCRRTCQTARSYTTKVTPMLAYHKLDIRCPRKQIGCSKYMHLR